MSVAHEHTLLTFEHGSPPEIVAIAHAVIGEPDVDPASSATWNRLIRARRVITEQEDGRATPWFAGGPTPRELAVAGAASATWRARTAFVNPPGDRRGELVAFFWRTLVEYFELGWCSAAIYVGFNVDQLSRLQRVGARFDPLSCPTLVPSSRTAYRAAVAPRRQADLFAAAPMETDEEPVLGEDPPHATFVTLLSRDRHQIQTFTRVASDLGRVVNGDRRPILDLTPGETP